MTDIKEWFKSEAFKQLPRSRRIEEKAKVYSNGKWLIGFFIKIKLYFTEN